jgi:hypothetical protein
MNVGDHADADPVTTEPPMQETTQIRPDRADRRHVAQVSGTNRCWAVANIHLVQADPWTRRARSLPPNQASVVETALDELAVAALAHEEAVANHGPAADEHGADGAADR